MLLCHYSFVNPSTVNALVCSQAAMSLCVQLGLHQEPSPQNISSKIDLESQRRIFWTCYALDAQNNMLMSKLSSLYGVSINPEQERRTAVANHLYTWRRLETEVTTGIFYTDRGGPRLASREWINDTHARIKSWREILDSHRFSETIEFRHLMFQFQLFRLARLSPRSPRPSFTMRRECVAAGKSIVAEYCRIHRQGNLFYWHHCCWHLFEIGIALVESTYTGIDLAWRKQDSFLQPADAPGIIGAMESIPFILRTMKHRWPQIERVVLELEEVFHHAVPQLKEYTDGHITAPSGMENVALIRKYFLGQEHKEVQEDVPCFNGSSARRTSQNTSSIQEALRLLHPATSLTAVPTSSQRAEPVLPDRHDSSQSIFFDVAPASWISPAEDSLFWHSGGLELDDIFTAFNAGDFLDD